MKLKYTIPAALAFVAIVVAVFFLLLDRERDKLEAERAEYARVQQEVMQEIMQEELNKISKEYEEQYQKISSKGRDGRSLAFSADSLLSQLNRERERVDSLKRELKQSKEASIQRIAQLQREIGMLRDVLKGYVVQIDSLHATNERLRAENKEVRQSYERVSDEARQLSDEKERLTQRVNLAAKLDATAITVTPIDKRGRATKRISKMVHLKINFVVVKNITAPVGYKQFYARIMRPDDEVMLKSEAGNFEFEGQQIPYSIRRELEYGGEELPVEMFWPIEETLLAGKYRLILFADGNIIGESTFSL